jgi:4,5-dihydroxyphthalate decarboxylase
MLTPRDMPRLQLSLIMSANPRSRPVLDGSVTPDGIDLTCTVAHPSEIFWRQLHFKEFDVSEMSLSSLLMAIARGNTDWVGLPIFTSRRFFHTWGWVRADAGIAGPSDLRGKRVGVPEYQQTAALWSRGVLQHEFGVAPTDM